jgi:hypothetical protein
MLCAADCAVKFYTPTPKGATSSPRNRERCAGSLTLSLTKAQQSATVPTAVSSYLGVTFLRSCMTFSLQTSQLDSLWLFISHRRLIGLQPPPLSRRTTAAPSAAEMTLRRCASRAAVLASRSATCSSVISSTGASPTAGRSPT